MPFMIMMIMILFNKANIIKLLLVTINQLLNLIQWIKINLSIEVNSIKISKLIQSKYLTRNNLANINEQNDLTN